PPLATLPALTLIVVVSVTSCTTYGLTLGSLGMRARDVFLIANVAYYVMWIFCGINVPLSALPAWMAAIGRCLPLTHGIAAARRAFRCQPTAQDGFGPFGRGSPPLRSSIGRGHVLTGTVLSALDCAPLRSARVEFWQEDKTGTYRPAGSATVVTDRSGRFRF